MSDHDELNELLAKGKPKPKYANPIVKVRPIMHLDDFDDEDDDGNKESFLSTYVHWTSSDERIFVPAAKTTPTLKPGVYEIDVSSAIGLYFENIPVKTDGLLKFPDTNSDRVINEIQKFWESEKIFTEYGLAYKRGILLYGPPGSGKSSTIQLIMKDVVERKGVVIKFGDPYQFMDGMRILRQIQPDTPVVVIMEDLDSTLEIYNESEILNILDGVNEVKRVVFIATTNYPEKLGARIVNRPSRFDKRFKIASPSKAARKMYFEHLIGGGQPGLLEQKVAELNIDLEKWVEDTAKMSIAHLKELFVAIVILGDKYEDAIATLKSMTEKLTDKEYNKSIGFSVVDSSKDD